MEELFAFQQQVLKAQLGLEPLNISIPKWNRRKLFTVAEKYNQGRTSLLLGECLIIYLEIY